MSVKNHLSRLGIFLKNPAIQCYRFLSRVDALFIQGFVPLLDMSLVNAFALHHAVPHIPEQADRIKQVGCSNFAVRNEVPPLHLSQTILPGAK